MDEPQSKKFGFLLSLTGYLTLQEKKERKGRLTARRGSQRYWFWFDEKDCALKYYKNQDSYKQYLHNPSGCIDMDSAKVTPAAAHHTTADQTDPNTFIITTKDGHYFALTADNEVTCHEWIKKLQVKRSEWIRKPDKERQKTLPRTLSPGINCGGLVRDSTLAQSVAADFISSPPTVSNNIRKIFYGEYQDPFEADRYCTETTCSAPPGTTTRTSSGTSSNGGGSDTRDTIEVDGGERKSSEDESAAGRDSIDGTAAGQNNVPLTDQDRKILELKLELGLGRKERDTLQKTVAELTHLLAKKEKKIKSLNDEVDKLNEKIFKINNSSKAQVVSENDNLKSVIEQLQLSFRSLDGEIELHKLNIKERDKEITAQKERIRSLQKENMAFKAKYVELLSASFKIPTPTISSGLHSTDDNDPYEEKLKSDLLELIEEVTSNEQHSVARFNLNSNFEDQFGDLHDWKSDSNICHFLCRHLYLHFTESDQEELTSTWFSYLENVLKVKERFFEIPTDRSGKREFKRYLRGGIPTEFRSQIWSSLINHHIGKLRDVKNSTSKNSSYYESLYEQSSAYSKQIQLDLYRTLPSNKHFKNGGDGGEKLQRVLLAYSNHNKNVGYCQGMNMIAAIGLMFLDEETAFWFLVTIIERLMPSYYYSHGLAAAQADQVVIKTIIQNKLSLLNEHFEANLIDVTIVTFNWFLTLFIDALPTESMLRIIDCFLLEGRKVLFRFSLAVLKLYERRILSMVDPVTMFQFVKEGVRHIYRVEELFKIAFEDLEPFPSRSSINSRCSPHVERFREEWAEREKQRKEARESKLFGSSTSTVVTAPALPISSATLKPRKQLQWECACVINENEVWLSCGERQIGIVCIINANENGFDVNSPSLNVGSRVLCIKALSSGIVMMGTLDFSLHAVSIENKEELWSLKMNDSILDFTLFEDNLLCALADGYIAVLPTNGTTPPSSDPLYYKIGNTSVQAMIYTPYDHIWCGSGKAITVLSARTLEPVKPILMSDSAGKVYKMELGDHGVWVTFKSSTVVCLFDTQHMVKLLQIDYPLLLGEDLSPDSFNKTEYRIIVATPIGDQLWLGTGNATIRIFSIHSLVSSPEDSIRQIARRSQEIDSAATAKTLQNRPSDEGLVTINTTPRTTPTKVSSSLLASEKGEEEKEERRGGRGGRSRNTFGKTFRKHPKKELSVDVRKAESVYELKHVSSSRVLPDCLECTRVSILKPIKYKDQQFVVSCVNSTNAVEKAVQLWQCSTASPTHWNYTCIPECYEKVNKNLQFAQHPPSSQYRDKGRTYSMILGSLPTPS